MALQKNNYKLFTKADFYNIIGKDMDEELANEDTNNASEYMITYVSNQIISFVMRRTGKRLFKKNITSSTDYDVYLGYTENELSSRKLSERQKEMLTMACVYQADYDISNGSTERMSGVSISSRTSTLRKEELNSYEICDIAVSYLTNAGLLYAGVGVGTNAWIK